MLEVLDTAGQEEFVALRDQWIRDGEGFVLVYAINSRNSFSRIEKYYTQIQRVKESAAAAAPSYPGAPSVSPMASQACTGPSPVMLVANKCDKVTERAVSTQEGMAMAKQLGCQFIEASAKSRINVEKAFYEVVRELRKQRGLKKPSKSRNSKSSRRNGHRPDKDGKRLPRDKSTKCVIL